MDPVAKISKEKIPGRRCSMHGYIQTCPWLQRENRELWVLNRWVFNFCVRSTQLRVSEKKYTIEAVEGFKPAVALLLLT